MEDNGFISVLDFASVKLYSRSALSGILGGESAVVESEDVDVYKEVVESRFLMGGLGTYFRLENDPIKKVCELCTYQWYQSEYTARLVE